MATEIDFAVLDSRLQRIELGWKPRKPAGRPRTDIDWLKVHGRVRAPEGEWEFVDSCLATEDVTALTDWLRLVSPDAPGPEPVQFIERLLRFEAAPEPRGQIGLRVRFRGEVSPPWIWGDGDAVWGDGYWLTMTVVSKQLRRFADDLDRLIGRRPSQEPSE